MAVCIDESLSVSLYIEDLSSLYSSSLVCIPCGQDRRITVKIMALIEWQC